MNRTIVGRITLIRGIRHQVETFLRQASDLQGWAPIAVPALLYIFIRSYQGERNKMQDERTRMLKQEKAQFARVEQQLVREIGAKSTSRGRGRSVLPRRVRRAG